MNSRSRFRRLEIIMNAKPAASTASLPLLTINNLDSGGNIFHGTIANVAAAFRSLGFTVNASYSPPTTGA